MEGEAWKKTGVGGEKGTNGLKRHTVCVLCMKQTKCDNLNSKIMNTNF